MHLLVVVPPRCNEERVTRQTGKREDLRYSRKGVRLLTFASSARRWAELHEEAFRRLGGAVRVIVPDNLIDKKS